MTLAARRRLPLLSLLLLASAALPSCGTEATRLRGLVLISIDTLRVDHVSSYGGLVSTPNLDRVASEGVLFEDASTPTPTTGPAVASLLTGLHPWHHEVLNNTIELRNELTTLAEVLQESGFITAAFVSTYMLDRRYGFAQGFDTYHFEPTGRYEFFERDKGGVPPWGAEGAFWAPADAVTAAASDWLSRTTQGGRRSFFLWVHYFDPHSPYRPPPAYAVEPDLPIDVSGKIVPQADGVRDLAELRRLLRAYRGEVRFVDAEIGRLISTLKRLQLLDEVALVITSDHGEGLGDHGQLDHGAVLFEEAIRVPLLLRAPGLPGGVRLHGPAQLEDLFPTLLSLLGLVPRKTGDAFDLLPWVRGAVQQSPRPAALGALRLWIHSRLPLFYQRTAPFKWIGPSTGGGKVYDLGRDARETRPRSVDHTPELIAESVAGARLVPVSQRDLDESSLRALRALGYLD